MNYSLIGREFLTQLRGKRSQVAWSRRLGYKSNVAYAWESGRRWPTAAETLRACARAHIDVPAALTRFYGNPPGWLARIDPATPEGISMFLKDLRGNTSIKSLAETSSLSRYAISRWLSGQTQPRLPDFLRMVDAASMRMVDLLAAFVDPTTLPSVVPLWKQLEARRRSADALPWTQAILRALELNEYRALPAHEPGWVAKRLGIPIAEEVQCLTILRDIGQVIWTGTHYTQSQPMVVDTRRNPAVGRRIKAHWTREGARRIENGAPGQFSYNVFTISKADLERIRIEHLKYYQVLRTIVAGSSSNEVVAVANIQLFALDSISQA